MKIKNKLTKISLAMAMTFAPSTGFALAGVFDVNVADAPKLLSSMIQNILTQMHTMITSTFSTKLQTQQTEIDTELKLGESILRINERNVPSPQACENMAANTSVLASSAIGKNSSVVASAQTLRKDENKKEQATQIAEKRASILSLGNCTEEMENAGVSGCEGAEIKAVTAGKNLDPSSLVGATYVAPENKNSKQEPRSLNSGSVVPLKKWGKNEYQGKEIAKLYLEHKYKTEEPSLIQSKNANKTDAGEKYNQARYTFLNRKNTAKEVETRLLAKHIEMSKEVYDSNQALQQVWDVIKKDGHQIFGKNFIPTEYPSEQILLEYAVNKNFLDVTTALNSLGSEGEERNILAIQSKIMLEQLEAQRDTNAILGSILMQSMSPVTINELNSLHSNAQANGANRE